ncbi:inner membrane protein YiaA [Fulvivirga sediminis]|uniref:YiaA/YiaB family protein n=1 Tax=Fulvivirga sediminis TaxID=2803949 RepID=A0A937JYF7_9BACT|nr:inner membrane protein YiaA [Fulvivirga sediminis]MBL3656378.1 YiaA/YiaB family protein [Fulvivirga sediminis]
MDQSTFTTPTEEYISKKSSKNNKENISKPSNAFVAVSWCTLIVGMTAYFIGLYNAEMLLNEKGYYFSIIMFGLFSVVSVQKSVRDRLEGIPVTDIYYGISWFSALLAVTLLVVGLWNAELTLSEKGFYAMSFLLSMFSAIAVQKNTRDLQSYSDKD